MWFLAPLKAPNLGNEPTVDSNGQRTAAIDWLLVGLGAFSSQTPLSSMRYLEALAAFFYSN